MAYEPTVWKSGDVVTSAKLNNIESGIVNSLLVVTMDTDNKLDHTYAEIEAANYVVYKYAPEGGLASFSPINMRGFSQNVYMVGFEIDGNMAAYTASSKDEYPVLFQG